jgi:hypothetical protein
MPSKNPLYLLALHLCMSAGLPSSSSGWDMVDRFIGLRFECPAPERYSARPFAVAVRDLADDLSAFGWVQVSGNGTGAVVGEFRGTHSTAPIFEDFLRQGPPGAATPCVLRHYPSTLIRFHFADFKILVDSRVTCFEENAPHQCAFVEPPQAQG